MERSGEGDDVGTHSSDAQGKARRMRNGRPRPRTPRLWVCISCLRLTDDLDYHRDYFCPVYR